MTRPPSAFSRNSLAPPRRASEATYKQPQPLRSSDWKTDFPLPDGRVFGVREWGLQTWHRDGFSHCCFYEVVERLEQEWFEVQVLYSPEFILTHALEENGLLDLLHHSRVKVWEYLQQHRHTRGWSCGEWPIRIECL